MFSELRRPRIAIAAVLYVGCSDAPSLEADTSTPEHGATTPKEAVATSAGIAGETDGADSAPSAVVVERCLTDTPTPSCLAAAGLVLPEPEPTTWAAAMRIEHDLSLSPSNPDYSFVTRTARFGWRSAPLGSLAEADNSFLALGAPTLWIRSPRWLVTATSSAGRALAIPELTAVRSKEAGVLGLLGLETHGEPPGLELELSQKLGRAEGLTAMSARAEKLPHWADMEPFCELAGGTVIAVGTSWAECSPPDLDLRPIEGPTLFEDPEYQKHCFGAVPEPPACEVIRKRIDGAQVDRWRLVEEKVRDGFDKRGFSESAGAAVCWSNEVVQGCLLQGRLLLYPVGADRHRIAAEQ